MEIKCKGCGGKVVLARACSMSFYTCSGDDYESDEYIDYVNSDNLDLSIDVCLSCGDVQDAWLGEPRERLKQAHHINDLRALLEIIRNFEPDIESWPGWIAAKESGAII